MFKRKNQYLPLELSHQRKLKTKILSHTVVILFISLLTLDAINAATRRHENELIVLIKNIHLMVPLGIAYLLASRHRDLIKAFSPLYITLVLLVATFSLAFQQFARSQNFEKKFGQEMVNNE